MFEPAHQPDFQIEHNHWLVLVKNGLIYEFQGVLIHRAADLISRSLVSSQTFLVGYWGGEPLFLGMAEDSVAEDECVHLRSKLHEMEQMEFATLGRLLQLSYWFVHHQFCGRCGAPTGFHSKEMALCCEQCDAHFYPRISPCVIGIITRGDRCLLAHNARFPEGMYSVIAGFVEVGESAEAALIREAKEEVGLDICNLEYVTSQAWPFPSQLMLGYTAEAPHGEIKVDGEEITHADWYEVSNFPKTPPPETISGQLISLFIQHVRG